jgi:DNA invertase Pin-like site-specific DNA recombinase
MKAKYIRVSTDGQSTARQEQTDLKTYIDKCSGTIPFAERTQAKRLLKAIEQGKINTVHVHSIDRLGRNAMDIQQTIYNLAEKGINVFAEDLQMYSLKDGKINPMFKMITDLLANVAQMERDSTLERQRQGIKIAKERGVYSKARHRRPLTAMELIEKNTAIANCLKQGMSLNKTAETTGKTVPTVIKVKKAMQELNQLPEQQAIYKDKNGNVGFNLAAADDDWIRNGRKRKKRT